MNIKNKKVFLAGHNGMVGIAIYNSLVDSGYTNIITASRDELDLTNQRDVESFISINRPDIVIIAAAKVGGILANMTFPADFLYDNSMITMNLIHFSYKYDVKKLLFISSSCSYPREASQPISENQLTSGYFEKTNEPLAISKVLGVRMTEYYRTQHGCNFISLMPTNLYGPNDYFDNQNSHVLPALLRRFHEAKINKDSTVKIWGTGKPLREFLHVNDFANAALFMLENYNDKEHINIGSGIEISIRDLASKIKEVVGFNGEVIFDDSKPDGMYRKVLDLSKSKNLGWYHKIELEDGLKSTYDWFRDNYPNIRGY